MENYSILYSDTLFDEILNSDGDNRLFFNIFEIKELDKNNKYTKLIEYISKMLNPEYCKGEFSLSFDSAKILIEQAKEIDSSLITNPNRFVSFILYNHDFEVTNKLLQEYGYYDSYKKINEIIDPTIYIWLKRQLEKNSLLDELSTKRRQVISNIFKDFNEQSIQEIYKHLFSREYLLDSENNELSEQASVNLALQDLLADYFFGDFYENVRININTMINFINWSGINIDSSRLKFYKDFIELCENDITSKRELFARYQELDLCEEFYDDIRYLKDESYKSIIDSAIKLTKDSPLYNKELSDKYDVDIYYANGEPFYEFVRSNANVPKNDVELDLSGTPKLLITPTKIPNEEQFYRLSPSFTYIGTENIQTFKNPNEVLTLLYDGITPQKIVSLYCNDSWSDEGDTEYANEMHTSKSLLTSTSKYPEILITDFEGIKPSGLLVYDEITEWDVSLAKKYNISILLVNTSKYEKKYDTSSEWEKNAKSMYK